MSTASHDEITQEQIIPGKIGLRCQPPALTLKYKVGNKMRVRLMPIRFLNKFGSLDRILQEMKLHHSKYLKDIPDLKIEKMLRILQEMEKGSTLDDASTLVRNEFTIDPQQDLNKLTDQELTKKKMLMEKTFLKNQLKDGDEGYEYDLQVDFEKEEKIDAGWDSGAEGEDFWT